jgi:hypothetical protein
MRRAGLQWKILIGCVVVLLSTLAIARDARKNSKAASGPVKQVVESPNLYGGVHYQSGNWRDPFLNPLLLKKDAKKDEDEEASHGLPPPGIAGTYIAQATLLGTAIQGEGRVAILRGSDNRAYFLKEGDRLFDGYLKTIGVDFATLVRETRMKSGKVLTQEVAKRLRKS